MSDSRRVLAVARTVTSTVRLLDALEIFRSDFRVHVLFVVDLGSKFSDGVLELLRLIGARVITYDELTSTHIDLVITASSTADVGPGTAPVVVVPHGVGFHKYLQDGPADTPRLSGVVSEAIARDRRVIHVLTDERQRALIAAHRPEVGETATVVRDPFVDRLHASTQLRDRYRRRLGIAGRQLVVMTSTWGEQSLFGRWQRLPAELLGELPCDEYAVAAILHPNVWHSDGPWQVRTWLADAQDAGLILIPPTQGWQATLVSADAVIGDHGSVTFYAAALGLPLLLGAFGEEVVPGTPMSELGRLAPRLDWQAPLGAQLRALTASHDPAAYQAVAGQAFGAGDTTKGALRTLLYRNLDLAEPDDEPELRAWPPPTTSPAVVTSFAVYTSTTPAGDVLISRFPAAVDDAGARLRVSHPQYVRQLAAYDDELNVGRRQSASTLICRDVLTEAAAEAWVSRHRGRHRLVAAATETGVRVGLHDGEILFCRSTFLDEPMLTSAVVYHLLLTGELPLIGEDATKVRALAGERRLDVSISAVRPA